MVLCRPKAILQIQIKFMIYPTSHYYICVYNRLKPRAQYCAVKNTCACACGAIYICSNNVLPSANCRTYADIRTLACITYKLTNIILRWLNIIQRLSGLLIFTSTIFWALSPLLFFIDASNINGVLTLVFFKIFAISEKIPGDYFLPKIAPLVSG